MSTSFLSFLSFNSKTNNNNNNQDGVNNNDKVDQEQCCSFNKEKDDDEDDVDDDEEEGSNYCSICYESYFVPIPIPSSFTSTNSSAITTTTTRTIPAMTSTSRRSDDEEDDDDDNMETGVLTKCDSCSYSYSDIKIKINDDNKRKASSTTTASTTTTNSSSINSDDDDDDDGNDYNNLFHHPKERIQIPGSDGSCCGHSFCRECLHNHCSYAVSIHKLPVRCPSTSTSAPNNNKNNNDNTCACSTILPVNLIRDSLLLYDRKEQQRRRLPIQEQESDDNDNGHDNDNDDDHDNDDIWILNNTINSNNKDWIKFQRLHRMYLDPSLISCTRCDELLVTSPTTDASNSNDYHQKILCQNCQSSTGSIDVTAVTTQSKSEDNYEEKQNKQVTNDTAALLYNDKRCKPCSHCDVPIYKESGCDHIICTQCHQDMCFKCGTHIYLNGNDENNGDNNNSSTTMIRNCSNCTQSYIDHRHLNKYRIFLCIFLPFYIPFYLMYILFACILVIMTVGCFCCLCCGIRRYSDKGKKKIKEAKKEKVVNYSTTGSSSAKTSKISQTTVIKYKCMPLSGIQKVLGFIFLPFLDLFRQCGFTCCCTSTSFSSLFILNYDDENNDNDNDDDNDEDDEIVYYDDDEYDGIDYLEENQEIKIRPSSPTSTLTARTDKTLLFEENVWPATATV